MLKPGGWIALTEVDNLFGHEPVESKTRDLFVAYARDAFEKNRYDFHMGSKLRGHLEQTGFTVTNAQHVPGRELSFDGPADAAVAAAWAARLDRMSGLRTFCGPRFQSLCADFLRSLESQDHRSLARVCCCTAIA